MNSAIAALQAQFTATFTALRAWVLYQITLSSDAIKGGVSSAFDTLKKVSDHFTSEVNSINTELGTKASTTDLNNAVSTINSSLATKANSVDVVSAIATAKNELIDGASTYQTFAAVETKIAALESARAALSSGLAKDGAVVDIAASVSLPAAPEDGDGNNIAMRYVYVFNQTPTGPASGTLTNATVAGFLPDYASGDDLTLTDGDQLFIDYDASGDIVGAQFHNDDTQAKVNASLTAQREDFSATQSAGKVPDSASLKSYLDSNVAFTDDIQALETRMAEIETTLFSIPN